MEIFNRTNLKFIDLKYRLIVNEYNLHKLPASNKLLEYCKNSTFVL